MFTRSLLLQITKLFLPLLRPLNFLLSDNHHVQRRQCRSEYPETKARPELTHGDVAVVMAELGLRVNEEDKKCCYLVDDALALLEEKHASWEELEEAFRVFDSDGDGFISPVELHNVMRRLGLQQGTSHEECERMLKVFDEDDDGMIDFDEFKVMMQGTV